MTSKGKEETLTANRILLLSAGILILIPAAFWLLTGQVWEDFLITFRQSANFLEGNGLTYNEGVLLHSFTSPLNVLIPTLMGWIAGTTDFALPLALYNLVSIACLAGGGLYTVKLLNERVESPAAKQMTIVFPLILVLSVKVTAFSVSGQEAGFWILFLSLSFAAIVRGLSTHWLLGGVGWAGLMWSRPDSPIHITLIALAVLLFPKISRKEELAAILKAALVCTFLYLPWFLWAWIYYGSPVPHTITAKAGAYTGYLDQVSGLTDWTSVIVNQMGAPFLPIYHEFGGWPAVVVGIMACLTALILATLIFSRDRIVRQSAFLFAGSLGYLLFMSLVDRTFPWYYPPAVFAGAVCVTRLLQIELSGNASSPLTKSLMGGGLALVGLAFLYSMIGSIRQIEFQQRVIENGVRKQVGLFLKDNMGPAETVYMEPIGYIGYYSNARVMDFPGLVSNDVVEARKKTGAGFNELPMVLHPDWLVVRDHRRNAMMNQAGMLAAYEQVAHIDRREKVAAVRWLPGHVYPMTDAAFYVYKRRLPEPDSTTAE